MPRPTWLNNLSHEPRESGLSVVLAFQVAMMFVLAPLASTGVLPPLVVDICRLALAATARRDRRHLGVTCGRWLPHQDPTSRPTG